MKVLVSGSSGLIGSALLPALRAAGHEPVRLVRRPPAGPGELGWDVEAGELDPARLAGIDAAVHLAGAGIGDHRWNERYKQEILRSRVSGTELLARALAGADPRPSVLVSAAAVGYYGHRGDEILSEGSSAGEGFLAEVCQAWEAATAAAADAGIRTVRLRAGLVLAASGGTLGRMLPIFKLGLGGRLGSGRQWWSWITLGDQVRAIVHCLATPQLTGPVNAVSPAPVTNAEFTKALGRALHRPAVLPVPAWAVGVALGREMAHELVFASQRVMPGALTASGFAFDHPSVDEALAALLAAR